MSKKAKSAENKLPLSGILVLDLSRGYPGSYTGMYLGDFGADVIRVDPPTSRAVPALVEDLQNERFAAHFAMHRNKRGIVLDLKREEARQIFYRLPQKTDVVIDGFRPSVADRLKIGYKVLREINPRLIYCSLTGFGTTGPYANRPGHDMDYCAISGLQSMIGQRHGQPYFASNYLADMAGAGLNGVIGILLALSARGKTGIGQHVDISYVDGLMSLASYDISRYFATRVVPRRGETAPTGGVPWNQCYKCKDGEYYTIDSAEPNLWANFCRALGREDLIPYQNAERPKCDEVVAEFAKIFLTRTRDEWWELLKDKEICGAPVYYFNESLASLQVRSREMVVEIKHPKLGSIKQVGIPIKLSETPGRISSVGTVSGVDTKQILKDFGYSKQEIESLLKAGVVEYAK